MANPRKFSEKIALHNQKQAEETAAFEQIMREVIGVRGPSYPNNQHHLHINQTVGSYRVGSLPNVNQIGTNADKNSIDLQAALNNLEEMKQGRENVRDRRHVPQMIQHRQPHHQNRHFQFDQKRDTSPYSTTYLSPPPDGNWRRTNSDSALHQSAMMSNQHLDGFHNVNSSPRRSTVHNVDSAMMDDCSDLKWNANKNSKQQFLLSASLPDDSRPKSCEVPGITIYPTQEDLNAPHHHIPISSNTGSLPDLTNLHFPAPLTTPIDAEDQTVIQPGSPYSLQNSPQSPHSSTLSPPPSTLTSQHMSGNVLLQPGPGGGGGGTIVGVNNNSVVVNNTVVANHRQTSPGPSPSPTSSRRRHHHNLNNLVIGNPRHHSGSSSPQHQQVCYDQRHVRNDAPRITVEGLTLDTSALSLDGNPSFVVTQSQNFGYSPNQQLYHNVEQSQNYVPPHSPLQPQMAMGLHRSTTPSDHSCSAPTSPVSHNISPIHSPGLPSNTLSKSPFTDNSYYNVQQTNVLQHQLEQFRMVSDHPAEHSSDQFLMMPGNGTIHSSSSSASSSTGGLFMSGNNTLPTTPRGSLGDASGADYSPQPSPQSLVCNANNIDTQPVTIYYTSTSQGTRSPLIQSPTLAYSKSEISSSNAFPHTSTTQPQTPQTPTSIPDIILTGPNCDDPLLRNQDFAKDIGSAMASMSGSFDTSDLFPSDEALRAGLDPIDFDGLQILQDIADNSNEDGFRLERS